MINFSFTLSRDNISCLVCLINKVRIKIKWVILIVECDKPTFPIILLKIPLCTSGISC